MKIAPIDIAHKTFRRKFNGLDPQDVYNFLRDVADQMEEIVRERNSLKEQVREKELSVMEYRERDETLKATIHTATRMSEQIKVDAEKEAELIVKDAHHKSDVITQDAKNSLKKIYQEIADLKRSRLQFETNLKALIQAHQAMLDQGKMFTGEISATPKQDPLHNSPTRDMDMK